MTSIPEASGIYKITCTVTGKFYIGSATNLRKRRKDHFHHLRHNKHKNPKLQAAFNKYGEASFIFEVLEIVLIPELLTAREQYWFDKLQPFGKKGFNLAPIASSSLGLKISPTGRANMSASRRGKPSNRLGYKATPETIGKLRVSHLGKTLSESARQKLSEANMNRVVSPATCEKIRLAKLHHTVSQETRDKISTSKTGHKHAPEVYDSRRKTLIIIEPDGTEHLIIGVKAFCIAHNLDISSLMRVAKGEYSQHKGWKARFP